jgi:hypothetical protein
MYSKKIQTSERLQGRYKKYKWNKEDNTRCEREI